MHELSIAQSIIEVVMQDMSKHKLTKVDTIKLRIGKITQVMPDALLFGFECLSKDTSLDGTKLIIETVPVKGHCKTCGQDFVFEDWPHDCPECGQTDIRIISGRELEIVEFEGS